VLSLPLTRVFVDVGHIAVLEKAKALGDYLIVGVHTDQEVNRIKGSNLPIMNLHERVLGVLSCRVCRELYATLVRSSVVSGQWSVVSGQWSVVSGQWSVVSGWSSLLIIVVAPRSMLTK
jgi:cytidyltransferase-like protein